MLPYFGFDLWLRHGLSPFMKIRQRARRAKLKISLAGSSQRQKQLRVTNVIAHGPGIKLLDGLQSTIGVTTYAYRCRAPLSTTSWLIDQSKSSLLFLR
jgi:hypothetical protein